MSQIYEHPYMNTENNKKNDRNKLLKPHKIKKLIGLNFIYHYLAASTVPTVCPMFAWK